MHRDLKDDTDHKKRKFDGNRKFFGDLDDDIQPITRHTTSPRREPTFPIPIEDKTERRFMNGKPINPQKPQMGKVYSKFTWLAIDFSKESTKCMDDLVHAYDQCMWTYDRIHYAKTDEYHVEDMKRFEKMAEMFEQACFAIESLCQSARERSFNTIEQRNTTTGGGECYCSQELFKYHAKSLENTYDFMQELREKQKLIRKAAIRIVNVKDLETISKQ